MSKAKRVKVYLEITDKSYTALYTASDIADILEKALYENLIEYYIIRVVEI